jgi:hypothetical protein
MENKPIPVVDVNRCICVIENFAIWHSVLSIKVTDSIRKENIYLTFGEVVYHRGPISWTGIDLRVRPFEEYGITEENATLS